MSIHDDSACDSYELGDYPKIQNVEFHKEIYIAYAVCGKQ